MKNHFLGILNVNNSMATHPAITETEYFNLDCDDGATTTAIARAMVLQWQKNVYNLHTVRNLKIAENIYTFHLYHSVRCRIVRCGNKTPDKND